MSPLFAENSGTLEVIIFNVPRFSKKTWDIGNQYSQCQQFLQKKGDIKKQYTLFDESGIAQNLDIVPLSTHSQMYKRTHYDIPEF